VTFKELRKVIAENQKLDDDKIASVRLRLWPAGSGNGHNNNARELGWKGGTILYQMKNGRG
jgi:hypothetical protein